MIAQARFMRVSLPTRSFSARKTTVMMSSTAPNQPTINFDIAHKNIFIGSCLRNLDDADAVKNANVKVVISLQDEVDLENQKIDLKEIASMLSERDVLHLQLPTSDADEAELRTKLPKVVAEFAKQISYTKDSEGVYIHCNGGRGRAPTIVAAYYFWLCGMSLQQAVETVQSARSSKPKTDVIKGATFDILKSCGVSPASEAIDDVNATERKAIEEYLGSC